jgi:hypothetical protein
MGGDGGGFAARKSKKATSFDAAFSVFWLPDLDSNQGPAD